MRLEADEHGLEAGGVGFAGHVFLVDQGVGFGEVRGGAALRRGVGHQAELVRLPVLAAEGADHIHQVAVLEAQLGQVLGVHQDHAAAARDAAVPVIQAVERGVVLVMAADGLQHQVPLRRAQVLQRADREPATADVCLEGPGVPRRVGQDKTVFGPDTGVEILEPRKDPRDVVPHHVVILGHSLPVHGVVGAEGRLGHPGHDHWLGEQVIGDRLQPALGRVDHGHGILHGQELRALGVFVVFVRPAQGGEDQRRAAVDHMGPVGFGGDVHGQADPLHARFQGFRVRAGEREIAAHGYKNVHFVALEGLHGFHGVVAVVSRGLDAELFVEGLQQPLLRFLPDTHGPVTLDVGVPADGAGAGAGLAEVALQEQDVDHFLDGVHRVRLLRDAQRPAEDGGLGPDQHAGHVLDLLPVQAGGLLGLGPIQLPAGFTVGVEAVRLRLYEGKVDDGARVACLLRQEEVAQGLE